MKAIYLLIISVYFVGCSFSDPEGETAGKKGNTPEFSIGVDRTEYLIKSGEVPQIKYTYRNDSSKSIFLGTCIGSPSRVLEKKINGEWEIAWGSGCLAVLGPPIEIGPGETYIAEVHLPQNLKQATAQWFGGDLPGEYRVVEKILLEWDKKKYEVNGVSGLPSLELHSDTFVIREVE